MTTTVFSEKLLAKIPEDRIRRSLARHKFPMFLEFVKIQEPPVKDRPTSSAIIPFEMWPHLEEAIELILKNNQVTFLKARQVGMTWLMAAYALWTAMYRPGAVVLLLSRGEKEAVVFLGKCKTIYRLLPKELKRAVDKDTTGEFSFKASEMLPAPSKITALPSTEHAGRSETSSLVIQDEADFHEHLEQNFAAVKPTIDAGGQLIMLSTVNKLKMVTTFKQLYKDSPSNGWAKLFLPWWVRPGRTQDWYDSVKASVPETDLVKGALTMSPELFMEQEYPSTEEEALSPSRVLAAFEVTMLKAMQSDIREPLANVPGAPANANIYQLYQVGKRYGVFTDSSHGTGGDFAVTVVMDMRTGYVAADIMENNINPDELAYQSVQLLGLYKNPVWAIEDNEWGVLVIARAKDLGYKNLWRDPSKPDRIGWRTDERNRYTLWGELMEAVRSRLITVPSRAGLGQFFSVIRNPLKNGRIEAMEGSHDDYPFAVGGAWQMRKYAHTNVGKGTTIPRMW